METVWRGNILVVYGFGLSNLKLPFKPDAVSQKASVICTIVYIDTWKPDSPAFGFCFLSNWMNLTRLLQPANPRFKT